MYGPTSSNDQPATPSLDREAYFVAAYELLAARGYEAVTIAALCERLNVTKGSFYHHFDDMPTFVMAFADRWTTWMSHRGDQLAAIADPWRQLESMQNDQYELMVGAESAIRAWARTNPHLAAAVSAVHQILEPICFSTIRMRTGDIELSDLITRTSFLMIGGIQLRLEPVAPERVLLRLVEFGRRTHDVKIELMRVDGVLRSRVHERERAGYPIDPAWHKPHVPGLPLSRDPDQSATDRPRPRAAQTRIRDRFFATARDILSRQGPRGVTMMALCDELNVNRGSFRHHFGTMPSFVEALTHQWEDATVAKLEQFRTGSNPAFGVACFLQQILEGANPIESAWRAWGHADPEIGQSILRVDKAREQLVVEALAHFHPDPSIAELLAEMTVDLIIGVQQPQPAITFDGAVWIAVEWSRRILRLDAEFQISQGKPTFTVKGPITRNGLY